MTWFRCGGGSGIPASLKNSMNAVLNKKFGTSIDYPPNEWPEEVNLLGALEEKTVSSSPIVTFSDGADDVPLKSCEVALPASLDGYSSADVVHGGKNIYKTKATTRTNNGVTYTVNNDGTISLGGEATATSYLTGNTGANHDYMTRYPAGVYTLSGGISNDICLYAVCYDDDGNALSQNFSNANGQPRTETISVPFWFRVQVVVQNGIDTSGVTIDPQLEVGSTATTYEPYVTPTTHTASLGRTIYGGTADEVKGEGTITHKKYTLDNLTWSGGIVGGADWCWYADLSADGLKLPANSDIFSGICDNYTPIRYNGVATNQNTIALRSNGFIYVNNGSDSAEPTGQVTIELATPTDFTFERVEINSLLGNNTMWSEQGDTEVVYRSSGTVTPITPTLITKSITANGTYTASDDGADGYDEVSVNVPSTTPFKYEDVTSSGLSSVFVAVEEGDYLCVLYCSYDGTRTFSTTGTLIFEEDINVAGDSRGIKIALCHLLPTQQISHQATTVDLYNSRLQAIIRLDDSISVSQMVDSFSVNDGNTSGYSPSYSGKVLSVAVCGGNNTEHFYDKTIPSDSAIENSVNGGLNSILHIGYGSCPDYDMYGYYGNGVYIGLFQ